METVCQMQRYLFIFILLEFFFCEFRLLVQPVELLLLSRKQVFARENDIAGIIAGGKKNG